MLGETFGRWTVIEQRANRPRNGRFWLCRCSCGVEREVREGSLRRGISTGCGCVVARPTIHGASGTPEHQAWLDMRKRCENPQHEMYPHYGGRGIAIDPRWRESFVAFLTDLGPRPGAGYSLDRVDVDGNYGPDNCMWSTLSQQQRNQRDSHQITYQGRTTSISTWAEELGLKRNTLLWRLSHGWSVERAMTTPTKESA